MLIFFRDINEIILMGKYVNEFRKKEKRLIFIFCINEIKVYIYSRGRVIVSFGMIIIDENVGGYRYVFGSNVGVFGVIGYWVF